MAYKDVANVNDAAHGAGVSRKAPGRGETVGGVEREGYNRAG